MNELHEGNSKAVYMARCRTAWSSDTSGRAWNLGWTVYPNDPIFVAEDDQKAFVVYEDDGRGNGNYVGDFDTVEEAARQCNRLAEQADERGF